MFRDEGMTLLFVSHDPGAIKTLCDRAILLDDGVVLGRRARRVLDYYNAIVAAQQAEYEIRERRAGGGSVADALGRRARQIESVDLVDAGARRALRSNAPAKSRPLRCPQRDSSSDGGILIRDRLGNDVFGTNTFHLGVALPAMRAGTRGAVRFDIAEMALGVGSYSLTVALHTRDEHIASNFDWWDQSLVFQVYPSERPTSIGVCNLEVSARSEVQQPAVVENCP